MRVVTMQAAKMELSQLVEQAPRAESFTMTAPGTPLVRVVASDASAAPRRLGFLAGAISVPDDFDAMGAGEIGALLGRCRLNLLLDTHLLPWAAGRPELLSAAARTLLDDPSNALVFSAASLWEIAIKRGLGRADFVVDPSLLRWGLLDNGYGEQPISGAHAVAVLALPPLHRDPFDRLLVAQAMVEGFSLVTADAGVARYVGPVQLV